MAYQIDRYNNTLLTVVEDGTIDQTTDLKLVGKNYAGYGEIQNENFIFLLENFAGANQPARPVTGQMWYDSSNSKMKFYDGAQWRTSGGSEVGLNEPTGLADGDFWWDSGNDQLYVYNGTNFILIGPQNAGEGVTQMTSKEVLDSTAATRGIITATLEDEVVFVISPTEFDLSDSTPIEGFDRIKKGITLKWTKAADFGITKYSDWTNASKDYAFWGTASASKNLVDSTGKIISADNVVTAEPGQATGFTEEVEFSDSGLTVGENKDIQIIIENGDEGVIQNVTGQDSIIKIKVTDGSGILTHVATFTSAGMLPGADNTYDIGSNSLRWSEVHAVNFRGTADNANKLLVGSSYVSAATSASNSTVAARDVNGNLSANLFQGTATQARYADLAEKYTTLEELIPGTVVSVCEHPDHEVEPAPPGSIAIGVVSTNPAVMMNSEADGQYIGLKGRLPVRVVGAVRKGEPVYVFNDGIASAVPGGSLVGVALESNENEGEKLVECVLKV